MVPNGESVAPDADHEEKRRKAIFAQQYIRDYDYVAAAIRCGYPGPQALDIAREYMSDPLVAVLIDICEKQTDIDSEEEIAYDRRLILRSLRRTLNDGNGSSRVQAADKLMRLRNFGVQEDASLDKLTQAAAVLREFATKAPV